MFPGCVCPRPILSLAVGVLFRPRGSAWRGQSRPSVCLRLRYWPGEGKGAGGESGAYRTGGDGAAELRGRCRGRQLGRTYKNDACMRMGDREIRRYKHEQRGKRKRYVEVR